MAQQANEEKLKFEWMSTGQVAEITGDSDASIRNWIQYLPSTYVRRTLGGHFRIRREGVEIILRNQQKAI